MVEKFMHLNYYNEYLFVFDYLAVYKLFYRCLLMKSMGIQEKLKKDDAHFTKYITHLQQLQLIII